MLTVLIVYDDKSKKSKLNFNLDLEDAKTKLTALNKQLEVKEADVDRYISLLKSVVQYTVPGQQKLMGFTIVSLIVVPLRSLQERIRSLKHPYKAYKELNELLMKLCFFLRPTV